MSKPRRKPTYRVADEMVARLWDESQKMCDDEARRYIRARLDEVAREAEQHTASNVTALVGAARDLLDYVEIDARRQREETGLEMAGLRSLADSLRAALGALRST